MKAMTMLFAVLLCLGLGILFLGDVISGGGILPHQRAWGVAGLIFTSLLLVAAIRASRSDT